ncbi:MAG TPA: TatD family hydrolase, partial [Beijerinckiaceae bacterium]|nr:TatD family hydrolase [Beijerinckiaceae bacterium]
HPHQAHEESEVTTAEIVALAQHPRCVAIGEAGLDYHYDKSPRDVAARVFRTHIAAARETGLPLVIHARDADSDIASILRDEMQKGPFKALLHCFTSSRELAETGLELGLTISFSGVLTFKNSGELRDIARDVPLDRLIVETDAPFLAPVPHRGKRNEPSFVVETAKMLAGVKNVSEAALAEATTANALRLFSKFPAVSSVEQEAPVP